MQETRIKNEKDEKDEITAETLDEASDETELLETIEKLQKEVEEKSEKAEDSLAMLQRLQAEFENYKKRAERERAEYTEYATAGLILKLLPALDDFERALKTEPEEVDSFWRGIEMVFSQVCAVLKAEGLSPIKAVGERFDPYYHECVLVSEGEYDDDMIIEEFEKGYLFRNRVLRPSKVKVGKRGE